LKVRNPYEYPYLFRDCQLLFGAYKKGMSWFLEFLLFREGWIEQYKSFHQIVNMGFKISSERKTYLIFCCKLLKQDLVKVRSVRIG
jgi:hypothetical protein